MRTFLILMMLAAASDAAVVGTGDSITIAGGDGVDLLLWRDSGSSTSFALRFGPTGAQLDSVPIQLPSVAGTPSAAAWDGSGFVIATSGSNAPILRLPVSGGSGFSIGFPQIPGSVPWSTVASGGNGSSLFVWEAGSKIHAASVSPTGDLLSFHDSLTVLAWPRARLVRDGSSYLLAYVPSCEFPECEPQTTVLVQRLDDRGNLVGPSGAAVLPIAGMTVSSMAGGTRPLLAVSEAGRSPAATSLLSFDPGQYRAARSTIRFPSTLDVQETMGGRALIGLGARIDLSDTGAPLSVNWAPVADGQRLAGVLPSSGLRILAPASGAGSIAVEPPASEVSEVGLAPVWVAPDSVWLKVDNRGPDQAKIVEVWVTARVTSAASVWFAEITRFGPLSRLRYEPYLKQGAGFEIQLTLEQPVDPNAFEAWVFTLGTDRSAANNYVSTRPPDPGPDPEPPARRRLVGR